VTNMYVSQITYVLGNVAIAIGVWWAARSWLADAPQRQQWLLGASRLLFVRLLLMIPQVAIIVFVFPANPAGDNNLFILVLRLLSLIGSLLTAAALVCCGKAIFDDLPSPSAAPGS
jgi:hypothetical protein